MKLRLTGSPDVVRGWARALAEEFRVKGREYRTRGGGPEIRYYADIDDRVATAMLEGRREIDAWESDPMATNPCPVNPGEWPQSEQWCEWCQAAVQWTPEQRAYAKAEIARSMAGFAILSQCAMQVIDLIEEGTFKHEDWCAQGCRAVPQ